MRTTYSWESSPGKTATRDSNLLNYAPRVGDVVEFDTGEVVEVRAVRVKVHGDHVDPDIVAACVLKRVNVEASPDKSEELKPGDRVDYLHKVYGVIDAFVVSLDGAAGATLRIPQIGHPDLIKKSVPRGIAPGHWHPKQAKGTDGVSPSPTT